MTQNDNSVKNLNSSQRTGRGKEWCNLVPSPGGLLNCLLIPFRVGDEGECHWPWVLCSVFIHVWLNLFSGLCRKHGNTCA